MLQRGRASHARGAWIDAFESLSLADQSAPLGVEDLELLATAAYMLGRDDEYVSGLERAHHVYLDGGDALGAAHCALWMGLNLVLRGEMGRATGWLGRARRLVERDGRDCVERGFLLLPVMFEHEAAGDYEAAIAVAADACAIGERFGDSDLFALAAQAQGILLITQGRVVEGLGLLDEAMVAVTTGELSAIVNGFVYCGVIMGCQAAYEPRRAQEWTAALTRWCERQPDMVSFSGTCLVHRAEIMQLHGAWPDALQEARRAGERCALAMNESAAAQALYRQGEVYRLQGEFAGAEEAYRNASRGGYEPQPGLALLRLAQGNGEAAAATIGRLVGETSAPSKRAGLLPAYVEVMLAVGDVPAARSACSELQEIAVRWEGAMMGAMVAHARGAVELAESDARAALVALRHAHEVWRELEAPYEAARARVLMGLACAALGDDETAALELEAAREAFAQLGAAPDLAHVDSLTRVAAPPARHRLTPRELQVLRLVAAGKSNRQISTELIISEHTVARHVQNIFAKLDVSSRTAASAFAFANDLL
ncbi:MAG: LuxR C-terminal-related transcriptional regulator [Actinomycetota bacterium]|nr:LuxR C-terminal-related transcriptional regulator [Actinomycetota bacterium]